MIDYICTIKYGNYIIGRLENCALAGDEESRIPKVKRRGKPMMLAGACGGGVDATTTVRFCVACGRFSFMMSSAFPSSSSRPK